MKNHIKFPLTLDNYLNPVLGKQDRIFSQEDFDHIAGKGSNSFSDVQQPNTTTPLKSKKKGNPRLRIL